MSQKRKRTTLEETNDSVGTMPLTQVQTILMHISDEDDLMRMCSTNQRIRAICQDPVFRDRWYKKHEYVIYVQPLGSPKIEIKGLRPQSLVAELVLRIKQMTDTDVAMQRLIHKGKAVMNNRGDDKVAVMRQLTGSLKKAGIKSGDTVSMVFAF